MEKLRWLWEETAKPPEAHATYDLVRLYAQADKEQNQPPPGTLTARSVTPTQDEIDDATYALYDNPEVEDVTGNIGLKDGDLLRVIKSKGPAKARYDSYFIIIRRHVYKNIDWTKTPYLNVRQPWDYPTDLRKYNPPAIEIEQSFIDTAIHAASNEKSDEVINCFIHQVAEYKNKGVRDRKGGTAKFRKAMEDAGKKPA